MYPAFIKYLRKWEDFKINIGISLKGDLFNIRIGCQT